MTITKNSCVSVKMNDGTTRNGLVKSVKPWTKNPEVTIVTIISTDGRVKIKADLRNCTEIPDFTAPVDPCMADWSLGDEKRGPMMMEGYYFSSIIYYKGKNVGKVVDEGNGGSQMLQMKDFTIQKKFMDDCKAWAAKNGHTDGNFEDFYNWWHYGRTEGKSALHYLTDFYEEINRQVAGAV